MREFFAALLVVAFVGALASCSFGGGEDESALLPESSLPALVLQPDDLAPVFDRFDEGALAIADAPGGERADPERFDRVGGWKARYRRPGSQATDGPLVVESRADVFAGSGDAEEELDAHREELELQVREPSGPSLVEVEQLGDEAVALTQGRGAAPPGTLVSHTVAWRYRNVSASVSANGFGGKLRLDEVLELARAQQRRMAAASPA